MPATFALPSLPYPDNALAPIISANTIGYHYGRHHKAYVDNLNKLVTGTELSGKSLEDIIKQTAGISAHTAVFNNAAQVWNHTFFWRSLKPRGGGKPTGKIGELVDRDFGGYDRFKSAFSTAAMAQFGSGWTWLIAENGKLAITKTGNADTPIIGDAVPLLTIDIWEHAYYLDYQNRRADYVNDVIDGLLDWDRAVERLGNAIP